MENNKGLIWSTKSDDHKMIDVGDSSWFHISYERGLLGNFPQS